MAEESQSMSLEVDGADIQPKLMSTLADGLESDGQTSMGAEGSNKREQGQEAKLPERKAQYTMSSEIPWSGHVHQSSVR